MSDTNTMRRRIASELNRSLDDAFGNTGETFATAVNRSINAAIQHYESTRFRWNEMRESEYKSTVSGTRQYALPGNMIRMDTLKLLYNGSYIDLQKRTWEEIDRKDTQQSGTTGIPTLYCIYGNMLRLFPTPNGAYWLSASYLKRDLPTSVTGSFTNYIPVSGAYSMTVTATASHLNRLNGWYQDGEELIRSRAIGELEIYYLKKPSAIAEMQGIMARREAFLNAREAMAYERLADETNDLVTTGFAVPYCV